MINNTDSDNAVIPMAKLSLNYYSTLTLWLLDYEKLDHSMSENEITKTKHLHILFDVYHDFSAPVLDIDTTIYNILPGVFSTNIRKLVDICHKHFIMEGGKITMWFRGTSAFIRQKYLSIWSDCPQRIRDNLEFSTNCLDSVRDIPNLDIKFTNPVHAELMSACQDINFNWNPLYDNSTVKPSGAMFAKFSTEREIIIDVLSSEVDNSEFIYLLPDQSQYPLDRLYKWPSFLSERSLTDPNLKSKNNLKLACGFDDPSYMYDQIAIDIVSETEIINPSLTITEKISRPMYMGMPFLTNPFFNMVIKVMGGVSYWDLMDIKIPTPPKDISDSTLTNEFANYYVEGVKKFRSMCVDKHFRTRVEHAIAQNKLAVMNVFKTQTDCSEYQNVMNLEYAFNGQIQDFLFKDDMSIEQKLDLIKNLAYKQSNNYCAKNP